MKIALIILFISWLLERGCINYVRNDLTEQCRYAMGKGFMSWFLPIISLINTISLIVVVINLIFIFF